MHTDSSTLLPALIEAKLGIDEFITQFNEEGLPQDWDAVAYAEWLSEMAHDIASDEACIQKRDKTGYARMGIDSRAGYLASFWETHHQLAEILGDYSKGVKAYFEHAQKILGEAIDSAKA